MRKSAGTSHELEEFVREHLQYLLGLARLLTPSERDAEDLVQDTLLAIVAKWRQVRGADHARAYARKIMINLQVSQARKRKVQTTKLMSDHDQPPGTGANGVDEALDRHLLLSALGSLSPTQRTVLVMHFYVGMTADEIGRELSLQPSSVRSSISRALAQLRATGVANAIGVNS
jgi:RNA polymerase sigma-70 factor (sigma-E family)